MKIKCVGVYNIFDFFKKKIVDFTSLVCNLKNGPKLSHFGRREIQILGAKPQKFMVLKKNSTVLVPSQHSTNGQCRWNVSKLGPD